MTAASAAPPLASVLYLRMRGWFDEGTARQHERRERLIATAQAAVAGWDPRQRVVLDAPDGLAVVGQVPPALLLEAAQRAAATAEEDRLGIGLHRGAIRAVADPGQQARLQGDGLETASALAGFAGEHAIVASQPFREALAAESPRRAEELRPAGEMVDERLRAHALYVYDPAPAQARAARRQGLALAGLLLLLAAGFGGREARERYEAAHQPAVVVLQVKPAGEVFVDGERKGTAPPLAQVAMPPGPHVIEIRNGHFKPVHMEVQLSPGEQLVVKHAFVAPPRPHRKPAPRNLLERFKFW
jgi:hypothetical protein